MSNTAPIENLHLCSFCSHDSESIPHLFIYCDVTKRFWQVFEHFWYGLSRKEIQLSPQDIMIGIKSEETLLNYLIILGKWYIFTSARKIKLPKINALIAL